MSFRIGKYKNKALDTSELRRRREESGIQIRKAKREEQVCTLAIARVLILWLLIADVFACKPLPGNSNSN